MNKRLWGTGMTAVAAVAGLATLLPGTGALAQTGNQAQAFADPAFQRVWTRTDQLVKQGQVSRSWYWGPIPRASVREQLAESAGRHTPRAIFR